MTVASVSSVERTVQKTNEWLKNVCSEVGIDDREDAWRILRGYFHVVRDRLTLDEAAQLAAQLTHLLRGVYWEGFDPGRQPVAVRERDPFLSLLAEAAVLSGHDEAAKAAAGCTRVMAHHLTEGEMDDLLTQLPAAIREVLAPKGRFQRG